ncbi:hypothetical protein [Nonomuraea sp. NPDC049646]|uniref:hypothetical protein n=1 Tax=unclassified Nonomuraea TaxID=2593643 RepID=UPI0037A3E2ED
MAHRVRLRRDEVETRLTELGYDSQSAQARAIGVVPSIHHRALKGSREPNAEYVLCVLYLVGSDEVRREIKALFDITSRECEPVAS